MAELAGIIILGIFAQWLAWRTKIPAILPLIFIGLIVGPISTLFTDHGNKLIDPTYAIGTGEGIFPGQYLFYFVSLAIGVILFEGGMTLKPREIKEVGPAILRLITVGSVITFLGAGFAAHYLMNLDWTISFLFAALIIVTGPTVIAPILQNLPLTRNISTVLKWEGIVIDPIGAFVAVLVFEFIISGEGGAEFSSTALRSFLQKLLIGIALGGVSAYGLFQLIKRELIPHYLLNVFTLASVLLVFVLSDYLAHESGLLTVVVMGTVLGNLDVPHLKEISSFKESLSVLLISMLFILLAANINMWELQLLFDINCMLLFLVVVLLLRPLGVFVSTRNSKLKTKEKIFISWVGPRGIVAAGVASLFGIKLTQMQVPGAEYITPLVFMIVLGTVLLNATTARPVAKLLGVTQEASEGVLFVGAKIGARVIGKYLQNLGRHVVLVDSNKTSIRNATELGLEAFEVDVYNDDLSDHFELVDMGYVVAMTGSQEVDDFAVRKCRNTFGEHGTYRVLTADEMQLDKSQIPESGIFSYSDDFLNINEVARDYPNIHEIDIKSNEQLDGLVSQMSLIEKSIPLFLKFPTGKLDVIRPDMSQFEIGEGYKLVYLGKELDNLKNLSEQQN